MDDALKAVIAGQARTVVAAVGGAVVGNAAAKAGVDPTQLTDAVMFLVTNSQPLVGAAGVVIAAIGSYLHKRKVAAASTGG
jgi:hypothetical protein